MLQSIPQPPLVSVIVPTRNRADLLRQTLESVRAQTWPNWECRVVDDQSIDETARVVEDFARSDARFHYQSRPDGSGGGNVCRNLGFASAAGDYIVFLDSDDLLAPGCLAARVAAMEAEPALDFAVFGIEMFRQAPGDLGLLFNAMNERQDLSRFLELDAVWQTMGPIWRRDALRRIGPWSEDLLSFQDWELHVRALAMGLKYRTFPAVDCHWRVADPGRESISLIVYSQDNLSSHKRLLEKVNESLRRHRSHDRQAQRRLVGLYLWLAGKLLGEARRGEAFQVWRRCRENGLIGPIAWAEGQLYLLAWNVPLCRRAARMYLLSRWPREMIRKGSLTMQNTPTRPGVSLRPSRRGRARFYEFPA